MIRILLSLVAILTLGLTAAPSNAAMIQGSILFSSFDWQKDGTTLSVTGPYIVDATGDLVGQTSIVISDLDYSPFSALNPLWETDGFTFSITSLSVIAETASGLELDGFGILSDKNGILEDTFGMWSFSGGSINWSSATVSAPVPEPSAALLFLVGALAVRGTVRRNPAIGAVPR